MKLNKLLLFVWLWCLAASAPAQKVWEKKPYQKWSKDEAIKILNDSPWAQIYYSPTDALANDQETIKRDLDDLHIERTMKSGQNTEIQPVPSKSTTKRPSRPSTDSLPVVIRLYSALPVRQALVRLQQIQAGYDKMNEEQRIGFDATVRGFLSCEICKNYYVVTLAKIIDPATRASDEALFQRLKLADVKGRVRLVSGTDEKRDLTQFNPPRRADESAMLFFLRRDDKGLPLISSQSKEFKVKFDTEFLGGSNGYGSILPRDFQFRISDLTVNGNIEF